MKIGFKILISQFIVISCSCKTQVNCILPCVPNEDRILENKSLPKMKRILESQFLKCYYSKDEIPPILLEKLCEWDERDFTISNSIEFYNSSDNISNEAIPQRRINLILKNDRHFFMAYNKGGRALNHMVLYADINSKKLKDFWVGNSKKEIRTPNDLSMALDEINQFYRVNKVMF